MFILSYKNRFFNKYNEHLNEKSSMINWNFLIISVNQAKDVLNQGINERNYHYFKAIKKINKLIFNVFEDISFFFFL